MKVSELKEILEDFDDDTEVYFAYNYGDYWHTTVADKVNEVGMEDLVYSEYHQSMKICEDNDDEKSVKSALVLR
jgi:hypothetical protein